MSAVPGWVATPEEILLGFARALRAAGVGVTADRERGFVDAVAALGMDDVAHVWRAGLATLCASPADLERYAVVFPAWFSGQVGGRQGGAPQVRPLTRAPMDDGVGEGAASDEDAVIAQASSTEVLRHRDVASLDASEKAALHRLFARVRPVAPRRPGHRRTPAHRGQVDARRTLRESLARLGEPGRIEYRRRRPRPRRVVLLIDVSGSMAAYADTLLRLAHRFVASGVPAEVLTLGTRLTHVTRAMTQRDAERAIVAAGQAIPDWSGGTRLAEGIDVFLRRWGRRGMARGAVVVIVSDGWERDAPEALGEQVRRLRQVAHRVIWANPHRGSAAYQPIQAGIVACLPHIDDFVAGHSLAAFEELAEVVARA